MLFPFQLTCQYLVTIPTISIKIKYSATQLYIQVKQYFSLETCIWGLRLATSKNIECVFPFPKDIEGLNVCLN